MKIRQWPLLTGLLLAVQVAPPASPVDPRLYAGLQWRNVGPFRGGRVSAVSGAIGQPGVHYAGFPAAGLWKTTSAGETWTPVFDSIRTVSSIGSVEVAPSNPDVVYVGTGDMITASTIDAGDGVYKSVDAGRTWQHLGLAESKHVPSISVDPRSADVVLVAAQGDPHRRNDTRGIFRTTDGGKTWTRTLFVDQETGGQKLARAYDVPDVVYATTVRQFVPPDYPIERLRSWQFGLVPRADSTRTGSALYKSIDGGITWRELSGGGLPRFEGRTSVAVAIGTGARRVFLISNAGLWRSDDGGESWRQMAADDERIRNGQSGYDCGVYVDPKNPDIVYTLATSSYKSIDGGRTFTGFKGAPGGDDPQQMWIDPTDGRRILMGLDQGAIVTLDGGTAWSSWYNQSTEQVYHVAADNSYPYWIYATQQDAGAIRTRVRGNYGAVTIFDWNSVNGWEWGTIMPDPLHSNLVYSSGNGIVRIAYPTEQWINVSPAVDPAAKVRLTSSQPIAWAPWDQRMLMAGFNYLTATVDGGQHWTRLSPDLGIPKGLDSAAAAGIRGGRGAIEAIAASTIAKGQIWVGTSNGLVHLTRDGGTTWTDVSIGGLPNARRANISGLEASPHAAGTAWAAVEYIPLGDHTPHVYRTRDFGRTWTEIIAGLPTAEPSGSVSRVIRADPRKAGLVFLGTETGVHVSFDDGDHWQPLSANLPTVSVRDMVIKDNDLIVGTYGRGIWVLDDFSLLRQLTPAVAAEPVHLFAPATAIRVRRNVSYATPLPPEVPHALNPPDGAVIDYWLAARPADELTLDVLDGAGQVVRHLSSIAPPPVAEAARIPAPDYWLARPRGLPTEAGGNRATWDLRYDPPPVFTHGYEINANPGLTPASPEGPLAPPGVYRVRLTVDGKSYERPLTVRNDPRSLATAADLAAQHRLLARIREGLRWTWATHEAAGRLKAAVAAASEGAASLREQRSRMVAALDSLADRRSPSGLKVVNGTLAGQLALQDNGDLHPTAAMEAAFQAACRDMARLGAAWRTLVTGDLARLNAAAPRAGQAGLPAPVVAAPPACRDR